MKQKIAITGGIGSGKSTLVKLIQESGFAVHSCDEIYQTIIKSPLYVKEIKKIFPSAVRENSIDKNVLAQIVFDDNAARQKLNSIAHPLIMQELSKRMDESDGEMVFAEVPLLFEANLENAFDLIIVIMRMGAQRIQAVSFRDNSSIEQVRKRIHAQVDYQSKTMQKRIKNCNAFIIDNNGDFEHLKEQWLSFLDKHNRQS